MQRAGVLRMSFNEIAIRAEGLGKCYAIYDRPQDRLKQAIIPRIKSSIGLERPRYYREFWALKNVSLEVMRGETIGIIGRNGSGKSTLLQLICGTLTPTTGQVQTQGRVAALLELGAGFNPEFTGRENVYMNGSILGLSTADINTRFDNIAAFADIGDFMGQPVKHYSSGMYARLAFAVAINVDPDILIVDEALAVGDEPFQRKCFSRINQMKNDGKTILFVSHAGGTVINLCDRAVLLNNGQRLYTGIPKRAVFYFQQLANAAADRAFEVIEKITKADLSHVNDGNNKANIAINSNEFLQMPDSDESATSSSTVEESGESRVFELKAFSSSFEAFDKFESSDEIQPFLNPDFVSETYSPYDEKGARIDDPGLYTTSGLKVNHIIRGERYTLRCNAHFFELCPGVRIYALIRTTEGIDLAGCAHPPINRSGIDVQAGSDFLIEFEFTCLLNPGTYFCNFAIQGIDGTLHHRIVDALVFRVLSKEVSRATGLIDIGFEPRIKLNR